MEQLIDAIYEAAALSGSWKNVINRISDRLGVRRVGGLKYAREHLEARD